MTDHLNAQKSTVRLAKMGMLVAISVVLVYFVHFPIFPAVAFLEYDPADIAIIVGTFAFGPAAGLLLTAVTAVIQGVTVSAHSGVYGILMHFIATGSYVIVAGCIYAKLKSKKGAVIALAAGTLTWTIVMFPANLFITPIFMGAPREAVMALMPFILAFNLTKAGANSIITFFLYKRISPFLHRDSWKTKTKQAADVTAPSREAADVRAPEGIKADGADTGHADGAAKTATE